MSISWNDIPKEMKLRVFEYLDLTQLAVVGCSSRETLALAERAIRKKNKRETRIFEFYAFEEFRYEREKAVGRMCYEINPMYNNGRDNRIWLIYGNTEKMKQEELSIHMKANRLYFFSNEMEMMDLMASVVAIIVRNCNLSEAEIAIPANVGYRNHKLRPAMDKILPLFLEKPNEDERCLAKKLHVSWNTRPLLEYIKPANYVFNGVPEDLKTDDNKFIPELCNAEEVVFQRSYGVPGPRHCVDELMRCLTAKTVTIAASRGGIWNPEELARCIKEWMSGDMWPKLNHLLTGTHPIMPFDDFWQVVLSKAKGHRELSHGKDEGYLHDRSFVWRNKAGDRYLHLNSSEYFRLREFYKVEITVMRSEAHDQLVADRTYIYKDSSNETSCVIS